MVVTAVGRDVDITESAYASQSLCELWGFFSLRRATLRDGVLRGISLSSVISDPDRQRSDWRPELIELEQQAKDNARVLLFVHDKETRSLASMVETGELSALKKPLVLAIEDQGKGVMGEILSDR
ncbi:hypothetical protein BIW11_08322 [Tropilaelaps mercedesae]|uniref:Uncharacterized protein n=1 Tax=Tropilaelaps mercedesae TaxID=418985 RepID=A0A1V9XQB5_9ACAR|nr:hypothetical protein BIW11_08322 [Tropilaelaps mercedesae]